MSATDGSATEAAAASSRQQQQRPAEDPGFELGEDVSQQRNQDRELSWATAPQEGREQLSARETMIKYGASLQSAIRTYHHVVRELMPILEQKMTLGLARIVTDFLYHDSGRLVTFANMLRNRDAAHFDDLVRGSDTAFQVCVRARPLFPRERAEGEYSAVQCQPLARRQVSVHEGSLDRSGRRMEMVHHNLMVHKAWDHTVSNDVVSSDIIDPLVDFVESGKAATVIMYGQTGTGKTYTFQGIFKRLCALLEGRAAEVTFVEVDGKRVCDLLNGRQRVKLLSDADGNVHIKGAAVHPLAIVPPTASELDRQRIKAAANEVALAHASRRAVAVDTELAVAAVGEAILEEVEEEASSDDDDDGVDVEAECAAAVAADAEPADATPAPATEQEQQQEAGEGVRGVADFYSTVMSALDARTQLKTERNPVSSRTHAVCQIRIVPKREGGGGSKGVAAAPARSNSSGSAHMLTLVDLAGSERKYETMHMSVEEHKRSADINYTLMTLRHVFRTFNARVATAAVKAASGGGTATPGAAGGVFPMAAFPNLSKAGAAELRRLTTRKMTKAREKLRRQADRIVLASHFRGSLLTRMLRASFAGDVASHRTKVIATVSPAATDVIHTINTLGQVTLMSPFLEQMAMQMAVEVLTSDVTTLAALPVQHWGPEEVGVWLRTAEQGRFAEVALPPAITGAQLLQLSQASLAELFGQEGRIARTAGEGESWVITNVDGTRRDHYSRQPRDWGRAIYKSLMQYQSQYEADHGLSDSGGGGGGDGGGGDGGGGGRATKRAPRPKPLKRGSGTGGGASKPN